MSVKKILTEIVDKIDETVGKGFHFLDCHSNFVLGLEQDLLSALQNSSTPIILSSILPSQVVAQVPNIEALIEKAINTEVVGTKIETDIKTGANIEDKLRILISDIYATPGINKGIIRDICVSILADLNNNTLTQAEYQLYLQAKSLLNK